MRKKYIAVWKFIKDSGQSNDPVQEWQAAWKILLFHWLVVRLEQDSYYYVLRREASDAHFCQKKIPVKGV